VTLKEYFENHNGKGILSTADADGKVNAAIYSRPHFMDDGTLAFIMRDRLTHHNLKTSPYATYLYVENAPGYQGKRLYLRKIREEKETDLLYQLRRRSTPTSRSNTGESLFLVFFELDRELPLVTRVKR
jgi:hypothetical protein